MAMKPNYTRYYRLIVRTQFLLDSKFVNGVGLDSDKEVGRFGAALQKLEPGYHYSLAELRSALQSVGFIFYRRVFPLWQVRIVLTAASTAAQVNEKARQLMKDRAKVQPVVAGTSLPLCLFTRLFRKSRIVYFSEIMKVCGHDLAAFNIQTPKDLAKLLATNNLFKYSSKDGRFFTTESATEKELVRRTLVDAFGDKHALNIRRNILAPPMSVTYALENVFIPIDKITEAFGYYTAPFQRHVGNAYVPLDAPDGKPLYPFLETPVEADKYSPISTNTYLQERVPRFLIGGQNDLVTFYTEMFLAFVKGEGYKNAKLAELFDEFFIDKDLSVTIGGDPAAIRHIDKIVSILSPAEQVRLTNQYVAESLAEMSPDRDPVREDLDTNPLKLFRDLEKLPNAIIPSGPEPDAPLVDPWFFAPEEDDAETRETDATNVNSAPPATIAAASDAQTPEAVNGSDDAAEPEAETPASDAQAAEAASGSDDAAEPEAETPASDAQADDAASGSDDAANPEAQTPASDAQAAESASGSDDTAEPEAETPASGALAALGELLDAIAAEQGVIVYYTPLFNRNADVFRRAGVADSMQVKNALRAIRPQYQYELQYLTFSTDAPTQGSTPTAEAPDLIRRQLRRRWGKKESMTAQQLSERVYVPTRTLETILESSPRREFIPLGKGVYQISRVPEGKEEEFIKDFLRRPVCELVYFRSMCEKLAGYFGETKLSDPAWLRQAFIDSGRPELRIHDEYMTLHETTASLDELVLGTILQGVCDQHLHNLEPRLLKHPRVKKAARKMRSTPLPDTPESGLFKRLFIPDEILLDVIRRQKHYLVLVKNGPTSESRSWALVDKTGNRMTLSQIKDLQNEVSSPNSTLNRMLRGLPYSPAAFPETEASADETAAAPEMTADASQPESAGAATVPSAENAGNADCPESETAAETTPAEAEPSAMVVDDAATASLGRAANLYAVAALIRNLFMTRRSIVYYTTLLHRNPAEFEAIGIPTTLDDETAARQIRAALGKLLPEYAYDEEYMYERGAADEPAPTREELVRRQILTLWGNQTTQTADKFSSRTYVPITAIMSALDGCSDFTAKGYGLYETSAAPVASETELLREIIDAERASGVRVLFYSETFNNWQDVLRGVGITSPRKLRKSMLDAGLDTIRTEENYAALTDTTASEEELLLGEVVRQALQRALWIAEYSASEPGEVNLAGAMLPPFTPGTLNARRVETPGVVNKTLRRQRKYFMPTQSGPSANSWLCLNRSGTPATLDDIDEMKDELNNPDSELNRMLDGRPYATPAFLPAGEASPTGSTAVDAPETDAALEELGAAIDALFRDGRLLLYYTKLLERHGDLTSRAGIADAAGLRAALQRIRPQYDATEAYVQPASVSGTVYEQARLEITSRWGGAKITSVTKLAKDLYMPLRVVQQTLQSDSQFKQCGRDSYAFENYASAARIAKEARDAAIPASAAIAAETPAAQEPIAANVPTAAAEPDAGTTADSATGPTESADASNVSETTDTAADSAVSDDSASTTTEDASASGDAMTSDAAAPTAGTQNDAADDAADDAVDDADTKSADAANDSAAQKARPSKPTPESRIAEIVEALTSSGQTIAYYRTILERNKILSKAYKDEEALRDAFKAQYPSFGYRDVYFEPRRRTDSEPEEAKIRRALILGWGDVERQKLDRLTKIFTIPASLVERTLKRYPDDFVPEGKGRFRIAEQARTEASSILAGEARLHREFREIMARPFAILHYETYFNQNSGWLTPLGVAEVKTLRRELANENKAAGLGYVFYKEYCEQTGSNDRYKTKLRRLVDVNWGDAPTTTVDALAAVICAPPAEIRDVLSASLDFRYCGGDAYQKI